MEAWKPPLHNQWSFSFYAAVRESFSSISTVCRGHNEEILEISQIRTSKIQTTIPMIAEASTTHLAFQMATQLQQSQAVLKGDAQTVITTIESKDSSLNQKSRRSLMIFSKSSSNIRSGKQPKSIDLKIDLRTCGDGLQPTQFLVVYP